MGLAHYVSILLIDTEAEHVFSQRPTGPGEEVEGDGHMAESTPLKGEVVV